MTLRNKLLDHLEDALASIARSSEQRDTQAIDRYVREGLDIIDFLKAKRPEGEQHSRRYEYVAGMDEIDAIKKFLRKAGRPQTEQQIIDELLAGGIDINIEYVPGRTQQTPASKIRRSLSQLIKPKSGELKLIDGKYGLSEWPDSMWQ